MSDSPDRTTDHSTAFHIMFGVVETSAIIVGLALSLFSLMAIVGQFSDNIWIHLGVAATLALFIPFLIADRLLPEGSEERIAKTKGLVTDVLAVIWLGFAFLFIGVGGSSTGPALRAEARLLADWGVPGIETVTSLLAGRADASTPTPAAVVASPDAGVGDAGSTSDTDPSPADVSPPDSTPQRDVSPSPEDDKKEDSPEGEPLTPAEIFEQTAPAVVSIKIKKGRSGRPASEGTGTGFFVDETGVIATNHHVIEGARSGEVELWDGRKTDQVDVLAQNKHLDLALLKIDFEDLEGTKTKETPDEIPPLELGDSDDVSVGQDVVAIGNPLGLEHTLTEGIVSSRRVWRDRKMIQVSVPLSPGNSGGPLLDMYGRVIGVSTAKLGNAFNNGENLNLAIPIHKLESMLQSDYPSRHPLGASDDSSSETW